MSNRNSVSEKDVVDYLSKNPQLDDTGLLTYIKSQLDLAFSIKDSDKDSYADLVTDSAKDLRIPARFRKRNSLITEFMEMLRLHLERKLEVCSRGLKEEERVKYGNLEARVVKILPTFFVRIKFIDGSTSEVNPNTITSARA